MKRALYSLLAVVLVLGTLSLVSTGQGVGGFTAYPGGHLLMVYELTMEDAGTCTYTLEFTPTGNGEYLTRTETLATGTLEDFASPFLFAWGPSQWLVGAGWLSYYSFLSMFGQTIEPENNYVIPGGPSFVTEETITIAGVSAVKGTFTFPDDPDNRVIMAISSDPAVPYPIWVRQEERANSHWESISELILTKYVHD